MRWMYAALSVLLLSSVSAEARTLGQQKIGSNTGLVVPRFASLASDTVNMRHGPSADYHITWQFVQDGLPVEITFEQAEWRKVRVADGTTGWMHRSVLSGQRTGLVTEDQTPLHRAPDSSSDVRAMLQQNVVVVLESCEREWCDVSVDGTSGWLPKQVLWGVYGDENL